jgi:hypothetical protein
MAAYRLPGGGKAWFLRSRGRDGCHTKPVSVEGHLLTGAYGLWIAGIAWLLADGDPGTAEIVSAAAIVVASTILYIVTVVRMSAPAARAEKRR